jgi:hypothetical protein
MAGPYGYKHLSSSGLVKSGPGAVHSVVLAAGSDAATATVYDETSGSGDVLAVLKAVATDSACAVLDVAFGVGCYVVLAGTGPAVTVSYL